MGTLPYQSAFVHEQNAVCILDGADALSHDKGCTGFLAHQVI
jgi:hypothetical protein